MRFLLICLFSLSLVASPPSENSRQHYAMTYSINDDALLENEISFCAWGKEHRVIAAIRLKGWTEDLVRLTLTVKNVKAWKKQGFQYFTVVESLYDLPTAKIVRLP